MAATARKLIVEIVGDSRSLQNSFRQSSHGARTFERDIGRASRGALAGSGVFRGLGRSLAFASGGFLAFASAGQVLRSSIEAATEAATAQRQLRAQFRASGLDLRRYNREIVDASLATSRLSGFTETDLVQSFTTAFRGSQHVAAALKIQSTAADVARGRHIDLAVATIALTKAYGGQTTALRRLGVQVPANLHGMAALEFVSRRFAGQAQAGTTAQERFGAALHNTEVTIGAALLPSLTRYLNRATEWLDKSKNQARIQRDVNRTVRVAKEVLSGLLAVARPLAHGLEGVTHALGGVKRTGEVVAGLFVASRILKWAAAFTALAKSLRAVAASEAAVAGSGALAGLGRTARLAAALRGGALGAAAGLGAATVGAAVGVAGAVITAGGATPQHGDRSRKYPRMFALIQRVGHGARPTAMERSALALLGQQSFDSASDQQLRAAEALLTPGMSPIGENALGGGGAPPTPRRTPPAAPRGGAVPGTGLHAQLLRSQLRLAQAQVTATTADDRRVLSEQARIIRTAISLTTNLKKRTQLYQQLGSIEDQIRAIDADNAAKRTAAQQKIIDARKRQLAKERAQTREEIRLLKQREQAVRANETALQTRLSALRTREHNLQSRIKQITDQFKQAVDTARQGIGELFAGPVLQPTEDARRRTLGLGRPLSSDAAKLTADLKAQTRQFAAFQRDLNRLAQRGAPAELIRELRAQGLGAAPEAHALATSGRGTLTAFLKAFGRREALVVRTARTTMRAQLVTLHASRLELAKVRERERPIIVNIQMDKKTIATLVTREQQKSRKGTAAQRGGRNAGVNQ